MEFELLSTLDSFQKEISIFFAGSILTRKKFWSYIFGIFTALYAFYRAWLFVEALKDPKFRRFLFQILTTITSIIAFIMVISIFVVSCASNNLYLEKQELSSLNDEFDKLNEVKLFNVDKTDNTSVKDDGGITNNIIALNKRLKAVKKKVIIRNNVSKTKKKLRALKRSADSANRVIDNSDNAKKKFKLFNSINVESNFIACKKAKVKFIKKNRFINKLCMKYYGLMKNLSNVKERKLIYKHLDLNECERYGYSFLSRFRTKMKKTSSKWNELRVWYTRHIPISEDVVHIRERAINEIIENVKNFKYMSGFIQQCENTAVKGYMKGLYFGIIPGRKLNEE